MTDDSRRVVRDRVFRIAAAFESLRDDDRAGQLGRFADLLLAENPAAEDTVEGYAQRRLADLQADANVTDVSHLSATGRAVAGEKLATIIAGLAEAGDTARFWKLMDTAEEIAREANLKR